MVRAPTYVVWNSDQFEPNSSFFLTTMSRRLYLGSEDDSSFNSFDFILNDGS